MEGYFNDFFNGTGTEIKIKSDKNLCQTRSENGKFTFGTKTALWVLSISKLFTILINLSITLGSFLRFCWVWFF